MDGLNTELNRRVHTSEADGMENTEGLTMADCLWGDEINQKNPTQFKEEMNVSGHGW